MTTDPSLTLRTYLPDDRLALERISMEIVEDGTAFPFEEVHGVLDYWFGPRNEVVVACDGAEVVGSYVLKPNQPDRGAHVANAGYMVAAARRGEGIGRALGEHSLRAARELGYRAMQFNQVVATNEAAVRLWQSLGFRTLAAVPEAFRHPRRGLVDVLIMFREL